MSATEKPLVLVTRPAATAQVLVDELRAMVGAFDALFAPAFAIEAIEADIPNFDIAIFTSVAGVENAPKGAGRTAYCVGGSTAQAARTAGYAAVDSMGAAQDLIALILAHRPDGTLLHIRGQVAKGDVMPSLRAAGLACGEVVTYRKAVVSPDHRVLDQVRRAETVVLPLFSAETVSILARWDVDFRHATAVAISEDVAAAARVLSPEKIIVAARPDRAAMTQATACLIA